MQSCSESLLYLLQHNRFMLNPWMITNGSLWHMNGNLTRLPHWAFWAGRFVLQIRPSSPHQIFPKTSANNDKDEMWESWIHKAVLIMLLVQIWEVMIQKQSGELFFRGLEMFVDDERLLETLRHVRIVDVALRRFPLGFWTWRPSSSEGKRDTRSEEKNDKEFNR